MKDTFYLLTFAGLLLLLPKFAFAIESIVIQGEVRGEFYRVLLDEKGNKVVDEDRSEENEFTVRVGLNGHYYITTERPKRGRYPVDIEYDYKVEAGFNGADSFCIFHRRRAKPLSHVSPGNRPPSITKNGAILWLTYCSADYLDNLIDSDWKEMPLLWRGYARDLRAYGFRIVPHLTEGKLRFLESAEFIRDANLDMSFKKELLRPIIVPPSNWEFRTILKDSWKDRKEYWPDGYQVASFKTLAFTNIYDLQIPLQVELKVKPEDMNKLAADYRGFSENGITDLYAMFQIQVSSVTKRTDNESFLPKIPEFLVVQDRRFRTKGTNRSLDTISYFLSSTNNAPTNNWLPSNYPMLVEKAAIKLEERPILNPVYQLAKRIFLYLAMACGVAVVAYFMIRDQRRGRKNNNGSK